MKKIALLIFITFQIFAQKVVFVTSYVEESTSSYIYESEKHIRHLKSIGITNVVHIKYPNDTKENFFGEIKDADMIVISGHGGYVGYDPAVACISYDNHKPYRIITKKELDSINIKKGCVVIYNKSCFTSGTSATDTSDIGNEEAFKRVNDFATMWFNKGAAVYGSMQGSYFDDFITSYFKENNYSGFYRKYKENNITFKTKLIIKNYNTYKINITKDKLTVNTKIIKNGNMLSEQYMHKLAYSYMEALAMRNNDIKDIIDTTSITYNKYVWSVKEKKFVLEQTN